MKAPAVPPYWSLYGAGSGLLAIRGRYDAVPGPPCRVWDGHAATLPKHQPTSDTRSTPHSRQKTRPFNHTITTNITTLHTKHITTNTITHTMAHAGRQKNAQTKHPTTTLPKHQPKTYTRRPTTGQVVPLALVETTPTRPLHTPIPGKPSGTLGLGVGHSYLFSSLVRNRVRVWLRTSIPLDVPILEQFF